MNSYLKAWEKIESDDTRPAYGRNIVEVDYQEFKAKVVAEDPKFVKEVVESLYAGDAYLLKNGFSQEFVTNLIDKVQDNWERTESSFYQMLEGCPDYHRIVDAEAAANYTFKNIRHSQYWFPWNGDPMGVSAEIMDRWSIFKYLGGFKYDEYVGNTPKDGIVDRFQVARYLPGSGISETHTDPYENQRVIISVYLSKRGVHYQEGGFYVVGPGNQLMDMEHLIDVGDIGINYATVMHGVDLVDPGKPTDWASMEGRWWMGLYSNSSDHVKERVTGRPADISLNPK